MNRAPFDLDAMIAAAMRRIAKNIERRYQVAMGRKSSTANRSVGQLFRKRKREQTT